MKITTDSKSIWEKDFEILKSHGLDTEDIWDLNAYVSFFNFSNRMMNFASVVPDEVNYTKGR
jgi:alkylhydroperoxidase family enzyme